MEEEQQLAELVGMQETQLERQARMRERARTLKDKREVERLALVEEKLNQRWRYRAVVKSTVHGASSQAHNLT